MNIYRWLILLLIPTLITLTSCGSDDDSSDGASNEEETTGTTGTTTGTTTGDDGSSCMSSTQRNNIRTMWDRAALRGPIQGRAEESFRNPDGTFDTTVYPLSTVVVTKTSDNSWQSDSTYCVAESEGCSSAQHVYSIAGDCYVEDGVTGRIRSASSSRLSVSLTDNNVPPLKQDSVYTFPGNNGRVRINTVYTLNGLRNSTFSFLEDSSGTTSTSSTASSTADTTTADATTGTTTGETGTTTGGFSNSMGFGF